MRNTLEAVLLLLLGSLPAMAAPAAPPATATTPPQAAATAAATSVSPLTAEQLIEILDATVDWYRTLGLQQQSATQPSDLLLFYANRQTADSVVRLAFQIARANAELLSSEASSAPPLAGSASRSPQAFEQLEQTTTNKSDAIEKELDSVRRSLATAPERAKSNLSARLLELQGELAMVEAQKNMFDTMSQFVYENDAKRANVSALKARIDAIAATIPAASAPASGTPTAAAPVTTSPAAAQTVPRGLGIWDLLGEAFRLSQKLATIDAVDAQTKALQGTFGKIHSGPSEQLQRLSARSDELATEAEHADSTALKTLRNQFDTLAWLFTQTSAIALPLGKVAVLLTQYRENLDNWRTSVKRQYGDVLRELRRRAAVLLGALAAVLVGSELWRRAALRYVHDARRRNQLLLLRRIVTSLLIVLILGLTFISHLSSFATFAGLLTAGIAVAMQSVLVSVVGYFILIGKYGLRVGDRVQVGGVTGEVIDLGLIRMHLLELTSQEPLGPTGRIVAFANSIVFQASGGLFRQIPGVNFTWHEAAVRLPPGSDHAALKERLLASVTAVCNDYRGEIVRQAETLKKTASMPAATEVAPQVQLQFSPAGVEAKVRYPVPLNRAAEVDERISRELHQVARGSATSDRT
jgi:small-conductance mechanosensitive channel